MFLRLGPWIHGEVRNGGFPDWLQQKEREGVILRSNDERYLRYVRRFWEKVYEQAEGYFHKDGGPIMGVQIENEYGHVGGLKGEAGETHMRTLTSLAKELGFIVPYYTATGWGRGLYRRFTSSHGRILRGSLGPEDYRAGGQCQLCVQQ